MSETHITFVDLLLMAADREASDIHLQVGSPPILRIRGDLVRQEDYPPLDDENLRRMVYQELSEQNIERFERNKNLDSAINLPGRGRFRLNFYIQRGMMSVVGRRVTSQIPDYATLNLPDSVGRIARFKDGLVLVTGPTGTGKSSTLAAVINDINHREPCHILCIEDPIEYVYQNARAMINQREVGVDTEDFNSALRYAVRQDPDIILVGEIRDAETLEFALRSAETGHLVFGTLHSIDATQTIGRILNFYPQQEHGQIRKSLGLQLRATLSQMLLPSSREDIARVPACELMFTNQTIRSLIMKGEDERIIRAIKAGIKEQGMFDFEHSLYLLAGQGLISEEVALEYAPNRESLQMKFRGIFLSEEGGLV